MTILFNLKLPYLCILGENIKTFHFNKKNIFLKLKPFFSAIFCLMHKLFGL